MYNHYFQICYLKKKTHHKYTRYKLWPNKCMRYLHYMNMYVYDYFHIHLYVLLLVHQMYILPLSSLVYNMLLMLSNHGFLLLIYSLQYLPLY